jgi:alcohol dehydrogenase
VGIHYAEHNLVSIPESVDFESAAILGCRFATSFRALIDQAAIKPGQIIAVYGCGGVGLSCLLIAKAMKAQVVMIDLDSLKLKFATELGADYTMLGSGPSVSKQIVELTKGGVHISIDAVGKAGIVKSSLDSLRKGGKHIQIGLLDPDEQEIAIPFERIVANELQIVGSHGMQASRYIEMMDLITKGRLNPGLLVQQTISLEKSLSLLPNLNNDQLAGVTLINEFT